MSDQISDMLDHDKRDPRGGRGSELRRMLGRLAGQDDDGHRGDRRRNDERRDAQHDDDEPPRERRRTSRRGADVDADRTRLANS